MRVGGRLGHASNQLRLLATRRRYRRDAVLVIKGTVPDEQGQRLPDAALAASCTATCAPAATGRLRSTFVEREQPAPRRRSTGGPAGGRCTATRSTSGPAHEVGRGAAGARGGVPAGAQRAQHAAVDARRTRADEVVDRRRSGPRRCPSRTRPAATWRSASAPSSRRCLIVAADAGLAVDAASRRPARGAGWSPAGRGVRAPRSPRPTSTAGGSPAGRTRPARSPPDVLADLEPGLVHVPSPRAGRRPGRRPTGGCSARPGRRGELRDWLRLRPAPPAVRPRRAHRPRARAVAGRGAAPGRGAARLAVTRRLGLPALLAATGRGLLRYDGSVLVLTGRAGEDPVAAGRRLLRTWLALARHGLAVHPLSQLLDCPATADRVRQRVRPGAVRSNRSPCSGPAGPAPSRSARRVFPSAVIAGPSTDPTSMSRSVAGTAITPGARPGCRGAGRSAWPCRSGGRCSSVITISARGGAAADVQRAGPRPSPSRRWRRGGGCSESSSPTGMRSGSTCSAASTEPSVSASTALAPPCSSPYGCRLPVDRHPPDHLSRGSRTRSSMPIRSWSCSARRCSGTVQGPSAAPGTDATESGAGSIDTRAPYPDPPYGRGGYGRRQTKIAVPGNSAPRSGRPLAPHGLAALRPLRLDHVLQHQAGGDDVAHPVAQRAVVLHVGGRAAVVDLDVGRAVEVRLAARPARPGRGRRRTSSASGGSPRTPSARRAAAPGPPRASPAPARPRTAPPPNAEQARSNAAVGERQAARRRPARAEPRRPSPAERGGVAQHPARTGPAPTGRAPWRREPARARRRARSPTSSTRRRGPRRRRAGRASASRSPSGHQTKSTSPMSRAVLGQVVVGVGVPPAPARPLATRRRRPAAGRRPRCPARSSALTGARRPRGIVRHVRDGWTRVALRDRARVA